MDSAREFGRYRLLEPLSAGGMGVVYRAVVDGPEGFKRAVVIKRILPELSNDEQFRRMLAREARLCALLHHPGIVQVQDFGDVDGEYFLALEYVDGHDLGRVLSRCHNLGRQLPLGVVAYIVSEVAAALAHAHDARDHEGHPLEIVHRDVSPSNIMLTTSGAVKLLDFGVARAAEHARDERTRSGTLKGKISYLSPEQAEAMPIDRRSDIFSLGIVFHEALVGRRLFRGDTDLESLQMVRAARVEPPSAQRSEVPPALDAIVLRMLARQPADRYQSCHELLADLSPVVHELHGDATELRRCLEELAPIPRGEVPQLDAMTVALKSQQRPAQVARGRARRRIVVVAVAAASLTVAVALAARAIKRSARQPTNAISAPAAPSPRASPSDVETSAAPPKSTTPVAPPAAAAAAPASTVSPAQPASHTVEAAARAHGSTHATAKRPARNSARTRSKGEADPDVPELKNPFSR